MTTGSNSRGWTDVELLGRRTVLGLLGAATVAGLAGSTGARPERETLPVEVAPYSVFSFDEGGDPIYPEPFGGGLDPDDLLYDWYKGGADPTITPEEAFPVPGPDGRHLTWGEFSGVGGTVTLKCIRKGTHVSVHADGLLPKGLYTAWVAVLFDDFVTILGAAPLGPNDGSESAFRASRSGRGTIVGIDTSDGLPHATNPDFPDFETPDCLLEIPDGVDVPDGLLVEIALAYHYDDTTHGEDPRPDAVEQTSTLFGL